jgi:hypothetical protein
MRLVERKSFAMQGELISNIGETSSPATSEETERQKTKERNWLQTIQIRNLKEMRTRQAGLYTS